jgi:hypothetical protein
MEFINALKDQAEENMPAVKNSTALPVYYHSAGDLLNQVINRVFIFGVNN